MPHSTLRHFSLALTVGLCACASPTLNAPHATQQEISQEEVVQRQLVESNRLNYAPSVSYTPQQMLGRLQVVAPYVAAAGKEICESVNHDAANLCTYNFELEQSDVANAYATGTKVIVTTGMMVIPKTDDELAFILSHEYAHNILGHVQSSKENAVMGSLFGSLLDEIAGAKGIDTRGQLGKTGQEIGQEAFSVDFEREADYLGLYILDRTGYDIRVAPQVWRSMSVNNPAAIYLSRSHPTNPDRFIAMEKTIGEILYKKSANLPIMPNRKDEKTAAAN